VDYTPTRHAGAVAAVLKATSATELHAVVGHSCGGVVAMALLAPGEARASRLVLTWRWPRRRWHTWYI
jgi:pimeloyl-ACP methyl ester carboxylesterase